MSENGTQKILIADDERSIRWVLREALSASSTSACPRSPASTS
jgi:hypothetical protein